MNDNLGGKIDNLDDKMDNLGDKVDNLGGKMDQMLDKQDELLVEVKDINRKFDKVLDMDIVLLKSDTAKVKTALKAKGII
jgi:hypothetical protein